MKWFLVFSCLFVVLQAVLAYDFVYSGGSHMGGIKGSTKLTTDKPIITTTMIPVPTPEPLCTSTVSMTIVSDVVNKLIAITSNVWSIIIELSSNLGTYLKHIIRFGKFVKEMIVKIDASKLGIAELSRLAGYVIDFAKNHRCCDHVDPTTTTPVETTPTTTLAPTTTTTVKPTTTTTVKPTTTTAPIKTPITQKPQPATTTSGGQTPSTQPQKHHTGVKGMPVRPAEILDHEFTFGPV